MAAGTQNTLYRETLATALAEFDILTSEIEQLKMDLDRLEHQRNAVEEICDAIQQWMHNAKQKDSNASRTVSQEDEFPVSTEEVTLIAQTPGAMEVADLR